MDENAKNKEQPISDRPLEEIYLEVICKVKEKIPDADCRCISIPGYDGADYFYVQKENRYILEISDWGRLLSTQTFLSDESCKRNMIETIVGCYSIKHKLNQEDKQELLKRFYDN
jgi:hypothetical protein